MGRPSGVPSRTSGEQRASPGLATAAGPVKAPAALQLGAVDDPYPYLAAARRAGSVHTEWPLPFEEPPDAEPRFCVLGYDEVVEVLRDHEAYTSSILSRIMGPMFAGTLIAMDEPEHRAHRALVAPAFRTKLLAQWEQSLVRRVVDEIIDSFASRGQVDLVRELTFAFPVRVIARILGLPDRDSAQFQRWAGDLISLFLDWDRGLQALDELRGYLQEQITQRRTHPRDDLLSELVHTDVDGRRLDDDAVFAFIRLLLPAGVETTYRSFGNLLLGLLTHPDQLGDVTRNADLCDPAVEEGLRWETPFLMTVRESNRHTQLGGVDIPSGSPLNVFVGSANRDERRWSSPERFDIHRPPAPHVAFGSGPHVCLGMHLARMETRVALTAVLERLHHLRLDPDQPHPHVRGTVFRSPDTLPVRFTGT